MRDIFVLFVRITCCQIIAQSAGEFVFPENTTVIQGNSAELRCRPNSSSVVISWIFKAVGVTEDVIKYSSGLGPNNYTTTSFYVRKLSDGSVNLVTNSTQLNDAGLYTCIICVNVTKEDALALIQQSAQLIVLDGEPICETTPNVPVATNVALEMHCTVGYRGNWAPVIEWSENEEYGSVIRDRFDTITVSNLSVTSTLKLLARNGTRYTCRIFFKNAQNDTDVSTMVTNTLNCSYTWVSKLVVTESGRTMFSPSSQHSVSSVIAGLVVTAAGLLVLVLLWASTNIRNIKWRGQGVGPIVENQLDEVINNRSRLGLPEGENCYDDNAYAEIVEDVNEMSQPTASKNTGDICGLKSNLVDEASAISKKDPIRVKINGKHRLIGSDGTEYLDMNGWEDQKQQRASVQTRQHTEYALIDHNIEVPKLHEEK